MNKSKIIYTIIILFCSLFSPSCRESNKPYVLTDFKKYTGIESGYKINNSLFKANQSRLDVTLTNKEKQKLENRFVFLSHLDFSKKYSESGEVFYDLYDLDKPNDNYFYYFADGDTPDEYFVICLSKAKDEIIYCENFRETPIRIF